MNVYKTRSPIINCYNVTYDDNTLWSHMSSTVTLYRYSNTDEEVSISSTVGIGKSIEGQLISHVLLSEPELQGGENMNL